MYRIRNIIHATKSFLTAVWTAVGTCNFCGALPGGCHTTNCSFYRTL